MIKKVVCISCNFLISVQNIKKHTVTCNGNGTRRNNKIRGPGKGWSKGKTYEVMYGVDKSNEIKLKLKSNHSGSGRGSTIASEQQRKNRISASMVGNTNWTFSVHKSGRGRKGYYQGFYFMSSWELAYIVYCLDHNINIKRNWTKFQYEYEDRTRYYVPDFIVDGKYVEVKGYNSPQFEAKKKYFPFDLEIIDSNKIGLYLQHVKNKYGTDFIKTLSDDC